MPGNNDSGDDTDEPWNKTDRARGFLTQTDREYLVDERELEGQQERNTRYRIRQRAIQGLLDVVFLHHHLSGEDRRQIAQHGDLNRSVVRSEIHGMAYDLLMFSDDYGSDMSLIEALEKELEVMLDAYHPYEEIGEVGGIVDRTVSVEVNVEDETYTPEKIENRLYSGDANYVEAMTYREVSMQDGYDFEGEEEALEIAKQIVDEYLSNQ
ncbi:MAG: hypothetical protein ABEI52_13000 [Halobacteriaceae archaeon]